MYVAVSVEPEIPHQLRHPLGEAEEHVLVYRLTRDGEGVGIERVVRDAADVLVKGEVRGGDALAPLLVREPLRLRPGLPMPEGEALELFEVLRRGALYGEAGALDLYVDAELLHVLHHAALLIKARGGLEVALEVELYDEGAAARARLHYAEGVELLQRHAHGQAVHAEFGGEVALGRELVPDLPDSGTYLVLYRLADLLRGGDLFDLHVLFHRPTAPFRFVSPAWGFLLKYKACCTALQEGICRFCRKYLL